MICKRIIGPAIAAAALLFCLCSASASAAEIGSIPSRLSSGSDGGSNALCGETSLGDAAADAVRLAAGVDIALVCGGDIAGGVLEAGVQTGLSIQTAIQEDRQLAVAELTPRQIYALLEHGVSRIVIEMGTGEMLYEQSEFEGFPQVSGLAFRYDAAAVPGERIMWIKLDSGEVLDIEDDTTILTVAAAGVLFEGMWDYPTAQAIALDITLSQAMEEYIATGIVQDYSRVSRMSVAGSTENSIISMVPMGMLLLLVVILAAGNGVIQARRRELRPERPNEPDWGMS